MPSLNIRAAPAVPWLCYARRPHHAEKPDRQGTARESLASDYRAWFVRPAALHADEQGSGSSSLGWVFDTTNGASPIGEQRSPLHRHEFHLALRDDLDAVCTGLGI